MSKSTRRFLAGRALCSFIPVFMLFSWTLQGMQDNDGPESSSSGSGFSLNTALFREAVRSRNTAECLRLARELNNSTSLSLDSVTCDSLINQHNSRDIIKILLARGARLDGSYNCAQDSNNQGSNLDRQYCSLLKAHGIELTNTDQIKKLDEYPTFVWSIDDEGKVLTQRRVGSTQVETLTGDFRDIAIGSNGNIWTIDSQGHVRLRLGTVLNHSLVMGWRDVIPGAAIKAKRLVVGSNLLCLDEEGDLFVKSPIFTTTLHNKHDWQKINLPISVKFKDIALDEDQLWAVDTDGRMWHAQLGTPEIKWNLVFSEHVFTEVAVGLFGMVCGLTTEGVIKLRAGITLQNLTGTGWQDATVLKGLNKISFTPQGQLWAVDAREHLLRRVGVTVDNQLGTGWDDISASELLVCDEDYCTQESLTVVNVVDQKKPETEDNVNTPGSETPTNTPEIKRATSDDKKEKRKEEDKLPPALNLSGLFNWVAKKKNELLKSKNSPKEETVHESSTSVANSTISQTSTSSNNSVTQEKQEVFYEVNSSPVNSTLSQASTSSNSPVVQDRIGSVIAFNVCQDPLRNSQSSTSSSSENNSPRATPPYYDGILIGEYSDGFVRLDVESGGTVYYRSTFDTGPGRPVMYNGNALSFIAMVKDNKEGTCLWGIYPDGKLAYVKISEEGDVLDLTTVDAPEGIFIIEVSRTDKGKIIFQGSDNKIYTREGNGWKEFKNS